MFLNKESRSEAKCYLLINFLRFTIHVKMDTINFLVTVLILAQCIIQLIKIKLMTKVKHAKVIVGLKGLIRKKAL